MEATSVSMENKYTLFFSCLANAHVHAKEKEITVIKWIEIKKHSKFAIKFTSGLDGNCSDKDRRKAFRDENGRQY